jgi:hypothetical protein
MTSTEQCIRQQSQKHWLLEPGMNDQELLKESCPESATLGSDQPCIDCWPVLTPI